MKEKFQNKRMPRELKNAVRAFEEKVYNEYVADKSGDENIADFYDGRSYAPSTFDFEGYRFTYKPLLGNLAGHPVYKHNDGWFVTAIDKNASKYGPIPDEIFGIAVRGMQNCFKGCRNMTKMPSYIPDSIEYADSAFEGCTSLVNANKVMPVNIHSAERMFAGCTSLKVPPIFTNTRRYTECIDMFKDCISLEYKAEGLEKANHSQFAYTGCVALKDDINIDDILGDNISYNFGNNSGFMGSRTVEVAR